MNVQRQVFETCTDRLVLPRPVFPERMEVGSTEYLEMIGMAIGLFAKLLPPQKLPPSIDPRAEHPFATLDSEEHWEIISHVHYEIARTGYRLTEMQTYIAFLSAIDAQELEHNAVYGQL